jgi:hypothetical protein
MYVTEQQQAVKLLEATLLGSKSNSLEKSKYGEECPLEGNVTPAALGPMHMITLSITVPTPSFFFSPHYPPHPT